MIFVYDYIMKNDELTKDFFAYFPNTKTESKHKIQLCTIHVLKILIFYFSCFSDHAAI